jgi:hypothetical protein
MEYTLGDVLNALRYCISNTLIIGFNENEFAKYYQIPFFSENKLITIVENKKTGDLFFYCNGKTAKPDKKDSKTLQDLYLQGIQDNVKILKKHILSEKINTYDTVGGSFCVFISEMSYLYSLAYCYERNEYNIIRRQDTGLQICKKSGYDCVIEIDNPMAVTYEIHNPKTSEKFLLSRDGKKYLLACKSEHTDSFYLDNKYFYNKYISALVKIEHPKRFKHTSYEQLLAQQFNYIDQKYQKRR